MKFFRFSLGISFLALQLAIIPQAHTQTFFLQQIPSNKLQFNASFSHPQIKFIDNLSTLSGIYEFSFNTPLNDSKNLLVQVPYLKIKYSWDIDLYHYHYSGEYSEGGIGNIFLGIQTNPHTQNKKTVTTFGLYLPSADEDVAGLGILSDFYHYPQYFPDVLSIYLNFAHYAMNRDGVSFGIEVGPDLLIPTGDNKDEIEVLLHGGVSLGIQSKFLVLDAAFLTSGILSEDYFIGDKQFVQIMQLGAGVTVGRWTAKVLYRLYLNDIINDYIDNSFGIGITLKSN